MEKKNMVLLTVIAVATLLVAVVGATFAYFTATITDQRGTDGNNGEAAIKAAETPGSLTIEKNTDGFASFNDENVYPGHKDLIKLKITSSSNAADTYFNIVYNGTNTFPQDKINFDIYESLENIEISTQEAFKCEKKSVPEGNNGTYKLYEECTIEEQLKGAKTKKLASTPLNKPNGETILNGTHPFVITGNADDRTVYYYIVVTYKNDESADQGANEQGQSISGKISIEIAASDNNAVGDTDENLSAKNAA